MPEWVIISGDIILGNIPTRELLILQEPTEPFPFESLPKEIKEKIIALLSTSNIAKTLTVATQTINALASVNTQLNQLINNPAFCIQLIKNLSQRFNCSDEISCSALGTQQAKNQLRLQLELYNLCLQKDMSIIAVAQQLLQLRQKGIDLNFTYKKAGETPLLISIFTENDTMAYNLIELGADPERADKEGTTPLKAAQENNNTMLAEFIKTAIAKKHKK